MIHLWFYTWNITYCSPLNQFSSDRFQTWEGKQTFSLCFDFIFRMGITAGADIPISPAGLLVIEGVKRFLIKGVTMDSFESWCPGSAWRHTGCVWPQSTARARHMLIILSDPSERNKQIHPEWIYITMFDCRNGIRGDAQGLSDTFKICAQIVQPSFCHTLGFYISWQPAWHLRCLLLIHWLLCFSSADMFLYS